MRTDLMKHTNSIARILLVPAVLALGACDLDVENPNALDQDTVFGSDQGMLALVVGMQDLFAENVEEFVQGPALVTDEWGTGTRSLSSYRALLTGQALDPDLAIIEQPWAAAYDVINVADQVIENAPGAGLPSGTVAGLTVVARLFKAMSFGVLATQFEQVILDPDAESPELQSREEALEELLGILETARTEYAALSAEDVAFLESRVLGEGFELESTIDAMLARYYLFDGQYQNAIDAAERVDLSVVSTFPYRSPDVNRICNLSGCGLAYVFPLASFAAQAEDGDDRVPYWVNVNAPTFTGTPDSVLIPLAQYSQRTDPFLVYVPDEMTLIRAEAYTRLDDFDTARDLINEVRTRNSIQPVADLPELPESALNTEAELLSQILYERRYELYEQGLRWEDVRRLSAYTDVEPTIEFFPIPQDECRTNPSLGC